MAPLGQRVGTDKCAVCRKTFMPGDRAMQIFIVQKVAKNPAAGAFDFGAYISHEFELGHVRCADPGLDATIIGV